MFDCLQHDKKRLLSFFDFIFNVYRAKLLDNIQPQRGIFDMKLMIPVIFALLPSLSAGVVNPGFDKGTEGWRLGKMSRIVNEGDNKCLEIIDSSPNSGSNVWSSSLPVTGGKYYLLSFKAKIDDGTKDKAVAGVYLRAYAKGREDNEFREKNMAAVSNDKSQWQEYHAGFKVPAGADTVKIWIHSFNSATGKILFDDFSIQKTDEATCKKYAVKKVKSSSSFFPYPSKTDLAGIEKILPDKPYSPGPPVTDRAFWNKLAENPSAKAIIAKAEQVLKEPVTLMDDKSYLYFSKTGSRKISRKVRAIRRNNFRSLVLAECLENKGRFVNKIEDYIESYLDMKTWVGPPHDRSLANFHGKVIEVDLMAVAKSMSLATTYSLLQSKLNESLKKRIRAEITRRIIEPYLNNCRDRKSIHRGFWWSVGTNNWNAVCSCGVVYSTLIISDSPKIRAEVVGCALNGLKNYLKGFTSDGYCSEGIGYWGYGFGHYMKLGEVLKQYSNGKIDIFALPLVKKVAMFPVEMKISGDIYPAFADSSFTAKPSLDLMWSVSRNFGIPLATPMPDAFSGTLSEFMLKNSYSGHSRKGKRDFKIRTYFDQAGILICRSSLTPDAFQAAIKAGHNHEHHNHNDVGSYIVLTGRFMPCCDPGLENYTARTFSSRRYESKLLNSWGHAVPVVAGELQKPGREYQGKIIKTDFSKDKDSILIDMKKAYTVHSLVKLDRDFVYDRKADTVRVTDTVEFSRPEKFGTAIVTYGKVKIISDNELLISDRNISVKVKITADGGKLKITTAKINEDNGRKDKPTRIGLDFTTPVTKALISVKYER